jgi:serine/threonine protein phosphatase PrpC
VGAEEELAITAGSNAPAECCEALVKLALQRGGPDNITVQMLRILPEM